MAIKNYRKVSQRLLLKLSYVCSDNRALHLSQCALFPSCDPPIGFLEIPQASVIHPEN